MVEESNSSCSSMASSAIDPAPKSASSYLDPHYWDQRFAVEDHYEWLKDYSHFQHLIRRHINPSHSVLELGCGNSRLCENLLSDGITQLTCIDLSSVAVHRMQNRLSDKGIKDIKVLQADMLDLPFTNECLDVVIEKGTMGIHTDIFFTSSNNVDDEGDSTFESWWPVKMVNIYVDWKIDSRKYMMNDVLFVDSGDPWKPHPETVSKVMKMLEGVHRILKPDGKFISISFGQPHFRRLLFEAPSFTWSIEWNTFGDGFHYFFYTLQKGRRLLNSKECCNRDSIRPSFNMLHDELEDEDYLFRTCVDEY